MNAQSPNQSCRVGTAHHHSPLKRLSLGRRPGSIFLKLNDGGRGPAYRRQFSGGAGLRARRFASFRPSSPRPQDWPSRRRDTERSCAPADPAGRNTEPQRCGTTRPHPRPATGEKRHVHMTGRTISSTHGPYLAFKEAAHATISIC